MRRLALLLPAVVASLATGCPGLLEPIDLPITLDSPPVDVDVGGPVEDAVDSACENPDDASCTGIATLCEAETGAACNPVTLPPTFPRELDVDEDGTPETTAEELLPTAVTDAARLKVALPADLGGLLADAGVTSAEQVKDVNFDAVQLVWEDNTLTFDAPILDVFVGPAVEEDELVDVDALLANAEFEKVGTIGKDLDPETPGLEVGQVAGVSDAVDLNFVDGGKDAFNARLKSFKFTLLVAAPEGAALTLKQVDGDTSKVRAPGGATTLKLKADLVYTVNLGEAAAGLTE